MGEPFDVALRVLKASLDQQMFVQQPLSPDEMINLRQAQEAGAPYAEVNPLSDMPTANTEHWKRKYAGDGATQMDNSRYSRGTMARPIQGMLARRGGTGLLAQRGHPSETYLQSHPQSEADSFDLLQQGHTPATMMAQFGGLMNPITGMNQGDLNIPHNQVGGEERGRLISGNRGMQGVESLPPGMMPFQQPDEYKPNQRRVAQNMAPAPPINQGSLGMSVEEANAMFATSEPMDDAWSTLMKGKKKTKPFHGYNPNKHSKKGGLNAKGRAAAKRKSGANLKPPVTTKPSKLKPGGKKAKRRKSFCARMTGVKGPTSKKGKLTPKGASLKRWNC
tara:strand:- start:10477 stop:11478 length:1002 start_codon:yes stop_codon:yes gene_type:complete